MLIRMEKEDLVCMVKGTYPSYSVMNDPLIKSTGDYCGGFNDEWKWDKYKLEAKSEDELLEIYSLCKSNDCMLDSSRKILIPRIIKEDSSYSGDDSLYKEILGTNAIENGFFTPEEIWFMQEFKYNRERAVNLFNNALRIYLEKHGELTRNHPKCAMMHFIAAVDMEINEVISDIEEAGKVNRNDIIKVMLTGLRSEDAELIDTTMSIAEAYRGPEILTALKSVDITKIKRSHVIKYILEVIDELKEENKTTVKEEVVE